MTVDSVKVLCIVTHLRVRAVSGGRVEVGQLVRPVRAQAQAQQLSCQLSGL